MPRSKPTEPSAEADHSAKAVHQIVLGPRAKYGAKGPLFHATVNGHRMPPKVHPITDNARWLIASGANPEARIEVRWIGNEHIAMSGSVRSFARSVASENATNGLRMTDWSVHPYIRDSLQPRLAAFAEQEGLIKTGGESVDDDEATEE